MSARVDYRYLLRRVALGAGVVWAVFTLLFCLLTLAPGDPLRAQFLATGLDPARQAAVRARFALDQPFHVRYLSWLWRYLHFDFGYSPTRGAPVGALLARRLPATLLLFGTAFCLQYAVGVLAGVRAGWRRGSARDRRTFVGGLLLYSVPVFLALWALVYLLASDAVGLDILPAAHVTTLGRYDYSLLGYLVDVGSHLLLPAGALVLVGWAGPMLVTRTAMRDVADAAYVRAARARGLHPAAVTYRHAARNALSPVASQGVVGVAFVLDGSVVVESIFSWNGLGRLVVQAALDRDLPLAMAAFVVLGTVVVVLRVVLDVVYTALDPRVDLEGER